MASRRNLVEVDGLTPLLRAMNKAEPELAKGLRDESAKIASDLMVPAYQKSALQNAGGYGPKLADSIRVRRDRIPAVNIGLQRKTFSGGASSNMLRYPTTRGRKEKPRIRGSRWLLEAESYKPAAMDRWANALVHFVREWNRGRP